MRGWDLFGGVRHVQFHSVQYLSHGEVRRSDGLCCMYQLRRWQVPQLDWGSELKRVYRLHQGQVRITLGFEFLFRLCGWAISIINGLY